MKKLFLYVFLGLLISINVSYSGEKKIKSAFGIELDKNLRDYIDVMKDWNADFCKREVASFLDQDLALIPICIELTEPPIKNKLFSKYSIRFTPMSEFIWSIHASGVRKNREKCENDLDYLKEELSAQYYSSKKVEYWDFGYIKGFTIFQIPYKILVGCGDFDDKYDYDLTITYENEDFENMHYKEEQTLLEAIKSKKNKDKDKSGL